MDSLVTLLRAGQSTGVAVLNGVITLPRIGAWHADLQIDSRDEITGAVQIKVGNVGTLSGTVIIGSVYNAIVRARIVAGGGGLSKLATPKHYTTPTIGIVLRDLARGAGETVSASASSTILNTALEHWTTVGLSTGQLISLLMKRAPAGTYWRLGADGSIWVGPETWPDAGIQGAVETAIAPEDGMVEVGLDAPFVLPGTTVGTRKVGEAQITITGGAARAKIWTVQ